MSRHHKRIRASEIITQLINFPYTDDKKVIDILDVKLRIRRRDARVTRCGNFCLVSAELVKEIMYAYVSEPVAPEPTPDPCDCPQQCGVGGNVINVVSNQTLNSEVGCLTTCTPVFLKVNLDDYDLNEDGIEDVEIDSITARECQNAEDIDVDRSYPVFVDRCCNRTIYPIVSLTEHDIIKVRLTIRYRR